MEGFDTISLDTNVCDICNQDTGENLINCIINDRCLQVGDTCSSNFDSFKQAHKDCLDRWKSVVQSTLHSRCPSPKRSWKDRLRDLLNRNVETTNICDAWFEVDSSARDVTSNALGHAQNNIAFPSSMKSDFLKREKYRVERINDDIGDCLERGRKLRVRSIDIEDEDEEHSPRDTFRSCQDKRRLGYSWTLEKLRALQHAEIVELHDGIKQQIKETSSLLIRELEEKDSLVQQADSLHTTVAQLVQLQQKQKIKTFSLDLDQQHHLVS